ncbi:hypothetical protein HRbin29_00182 [bacterium HR29]|jgi:uncharacterized membrane protein YfcA|nr:hypothetical protein HRbin29_00182 [bacterium HR29]
MPLPALLLAFAAAAFAGAAQAFSGFGFGLLIVPLLVLLVGPRDAVVASNVLGTCLVAAMVARERADVEWSRAVRLVGFAIAGMPLGMAAFLWLPTRWLQVCIAVAVLGGTVAVARGFRIGSASLAADAVAGLLSGALRMATSMSGPPVVLYLQSTGMSPRTFRATISAFFLGSGLIAAPVLLASGEAGSGAFAAIAGGVPGLALGWWVGTRLFGRVSERVFRAALFAILAASSLTALALAFR